MRSTFLRRPGLLASAALAAAASLVLATSAFAGVATTDDERAQPFLRFVDFNHPEACTAGGLSGTPIHPGKFTYAGGDNQKHLDVTALPADFEVTGMLVRAGDVFNVYLAGQLGDALPWTGLRAPVVGEAGLPEIGEWFGCGVAVEKPPTSTITTTTTTTVATSTVTRSSTSITTTTTAPLSFNEVVPTTTTAPVLVVQQQQGGLAATGFGSAWLVGLGAVLVAAGVAVVLVMRRRRV